MMAVKSGCDMSMTSSRLYIYMALIFTWLPLQIILAPGHEADVCIGHSRECKPVSQPQKSSTFGIMAIRCTNQKWWSSFACDREHGDPEMRNPGHAPAGQCASIRIDVNIIFEAKKARVSTTPTVLLSCLASQDMILWSRVRVFTLVDLDWGLDTYNLRGMWSLKPGAQQTPTTLYCSHASNVSFKTWFSDGGFFTFGSDNLLRPSTGWNFALAMPRGPGRASMSVVIGMNISQEGGWVFTFVLCNRSLFQYEY